MLTRGITQYYHFWVFILSILGFSGYVEPFREYESLIDIWFEKDKLCDIE